jgi:Ser/Thr protein kinase RdoA (MazF antagonist)
LSFFPIDSLPDNISPPQRKPLGEYVKQAKTDVAVKVLTNWRIAKDLLIEHISNNVWRVGSEYILKSGKRDWLLQSIRLMKLLSEYGVSAGEIIPTESGADYVDGEQVWILYRAVKGEPLAMIERFGDNHSIFAFKFGEAIGKLHTALASIDDADVADVDLYKQVTEWALPKAGVGDDLPDSFIEELCELCSSLPKQLIHRDTHPENIMWDNGEVSGFIDFDIAQRNVRLWDVCYCSTALLPDCKSEKRDLWFEVLRSMLAGYDSVVALTDAERRAVFYVICSVQIVFIAFGVGQDEYREMTEMNREMLSFIARNKERISGII